MKTIYLIKGNTAYELETFKPICVPQKRAYVKKCFLVYFKYLDAHRIGE